MSTPTITQFIDTNKLPSVKTPQGELKEILNQQIAGAQNVHVSLRWLNPGQKFTPETIEKHQLLYFMEGKGTISLEGKDYEVGKGAGIYLGPKETASITAGAPVQLFHITVPHIPK
jgi:mannose-6-phosphate isomerase-like protein (cupin superfamily)